MNKHKSEVLTVKIQLKVKFPQAVIVHRYVRKCSEQIYDGKLGTTGSAIRHVKPLICVV